MEEIKSSNGTIGKVFGAILILLSIAFLVLALIQEPSTSTEECAPQQGEVILQSAPAVQQDDKFNF